MGVAVRVTASHRRAAHRTDSAGRLSAIARQFPADAGARRAKKRSCTVQLLFLLRKILLVP